MLFQACAYCSHPNPLGTNFCNDCGAALHLQPCRRCGAVSVATATICRSCKQPFPERPVIDVAIPWAGAGDMRTKEGRPAVTVPPPISSIAAQSGPAKATGKPRAPLVPPFPGDGADGRRAGFADAPDPLSSPRAEAGAGTPLGNAGHSVPRGAPGMTPGDPTPREARAVSDEAAAATRRLIEKASQAKLLRQRDEASHRGGELVLPVQVQRQRMPRPTTDPFDVTSPMDSVLRIEPMRADPLISVGTGSGGALVAFPARPIGQRANRLSAPRIVALVLIVALVVAGWLLFDRFEVFQKGGLRLPAFGGEVGPALQARPGEPTGAATESPSAPHATAQGGAQTDPRATQGATPVTTHPTTAGASPAVAPATTAGASPAVAPATTAGASPAVAPATTAGASPAVAPATTAGASPAVSPATTAGASPAVSACHDGRREPRRGPCHDCRRKPRRTSCHDCRRRDPRRDP